MSRASSAPRHGTGSVRARKRGVDAADGLALRLEELRQAGGMPSTLRELGVERDALAGLAAGAATQWTGTFNPRPFDASAALALYESAY